MNIETLRILCDLVELQNFSRTAEKHYISQSAVSQQLAQLELEHKCKFVNRSTRPLSLTNAGELFYRACKDILDRYDQLKSDIRTLNQSTGRINLTAIFSIGMYTLQPYVKRFMAQYPGTKLKIEYSNSEQIYESVLKGDVDIGIVAMPHKNRNIDVHPFEKEPLVIVCSPKDTLANSSSIDIHSLQSREFIAFEKNVPSRTLIDGIFSQYNVTVRTVMEFDNTETIKRAVEINSGISILPATTIRAELANGTLRAIRFSNENFYRPTGIILRKNKTLTQSGRYLIELLSKQLQ